jgi:hypothetical protein
MKSIAHLALEGFFTVLARKMVGCAKGGLDDDDVGRHHGHVRCRHVPVWYAAVVPCVQTSHPADLYHEHCCTQHMACPARVSGLGWLES